MKKLKWGKSRDVYFTEGISVDFRILKSAPFFQLSKKQYLSWESVACFNKLSSAKKVAQLIYNG